MNMNQAPQANMNQAPQGHPQSPQANANSRYNTLVTKVIDRNDATPEEVAESSHLLSSRNELENNQHDKILKKRWVEDDNRAIKFTRHSGAEDKVEDRMDLHEISTLVKEKEQKEVVVFGCNGRRYSMDMYFHTNSYRVKKPVMYEFWNDQEIIRGDEFVVWLFNQRDHLDRLCFIISRV